MHTMHILSSQAYGKGGGDMQCFSKENSLNSGCCLHPTLSPNAFGRIGILLYFFNSIDEQLMAWRYYN